MGRRARMRLSICFMLVMEVLFVRGGQCGNLDDPGAPTSSSSAMYTIEDLYRSLNGETGVARRTGAFSEPTSGPTAGTGHTLDDVMDQVKHRSLVRKTGQTLCYNEAGTVIPCAGTGQDGEYQRGVAWPSPRFTDNNNGTVTDNLTGLIWLKNANCNGTMTWANGLNWAKRLCDGCTNCGGTNGDCGLSDGSTAGQWRVPNREELVSLVHRGFYEPALSNAQGTGKWTAGNPFSSVQSCYWSSNTAYQWAGHAFYLCFTEGYLYDGDKSSTYYVWPVRGGQ